MTQAAATELYGRTLRSSAWIPGANPDQCVMRYLDGRTVPLPLGRWCGPLDAADRDLLARCAGPTLDIGCGPGRLVTALVKAGQPALGVDIAGAAVELTRRAGAPAVHRSVFERLPGEGRWRTALLADGNVGIGGDVRELLDRCAELLSADGRLLVELDAPGTGTYAVQVRLETRHDVSRWFSWARVAADDISAVAANSRWSVQDEWSRAERWFAMLTK